MDGARRGGARIGRRLARVLALLAVAAIAVALAACGEDDGGSTSASEPADAGLRVEVTPSRAGPSDVVRARVVNDSGEEFTYGLDYTLEMQEGDSFVKVSAPKVVPMIALVAKPGETGPPVKVKIPEDAVAGQYRIVIQRDVPDVGDLSGELEITGDY